MGINNNEIIQAIARETANGDAENASLKVLYDEYRISFYFTALSFLRNEKKAQNAAAEAFRRLRDTSYRFDETLNAEYWFFDVLYTLCANAGGTLALKQTKSIPNVPKDLVHEPEAYIKMYSDLEAGDIASLADKKRSEVKRILKNDEKWDVVKNIAPQYCPDYWDVIIGSEPTGFEEYSEKERIKTEEEEIHQKRAGSAKRIIAIVLVVTFICSAIMTAVVLFTKKFGSDRDKNEANEEIVLQFNNSIAVTEMNGELFYCQDGCLWKYSTKSGEKRKISEDYPKELLSDGTYVYYRNNSDGYMYRVDSEGGNRLLLCDTPGAAMALHDGKIYFSTGDCIYSIPSSGAKISEAELLLDISSDSNLYCVDTEVDENGNVFFAGGIGKGIHFITEFNGEPSLDGIFADEVYALKLDNGFIYFDYKEANGNIFLYKFDIEKYLNAKQGERVMPQVVYDKDDKKAGLATGAFDVSGGDIYFAGEDKDVSALYCIDKAGNRKKITEIPTSETQIKKKLVISDVHVFGEKVYYFCSDGKSGGDRAFFEFDMNTNSTNKIF